MVKIYSIPQCPYCTELKEKLTENNIEFVDVNVYLEENRGEYDMIVEKTNSDEVPIVRVGKQLLVPNVSFNSINEAFDLTKKFLV
jgi:glutaredoxin 3